MNKQTKLSLTAFSIAAFSLSSLAFAEADMKSADVKAEAPVVEATAAKSDEKQMNMEEVMKVMAHVSPMPSLMMVVNKNADTLKLTDEQKANFKQFREEHGAKGKKLAKAIIAEEKAIKEAVLAGEPADKIKTMLTSTMEKREQVSYAKLMCRDNLKKTLDEAQWEKVIELYKVSTAS